MRLKTLLLLIGLVAVLAVTAQAQDPNDPGIPDTIALVLAQGPDASLGQMNVQLDIYVYSDEAIVGGSSGYTWDNANLQMDSAFTSPLVTAGWDLVRAVYEQSQNCSADPNCLTNQNQRFPLGGAAIFSGGIPADASGRRLWASYFFTLSSWTVNDSIVFDTLTFDQSSIWIFSAAGQIVFQPIFEGPLVVYDPNRPAGANLVVTPDSLNFSAVQGGANPPAQPVLINSDGDPLDFSLTNTQTWLAYSDTSGVTDQVVNVSVDISGLPAGTYVDTIVVSSTSALNSPQLVKVVLEIEAPKLLAIDPDTLVFTAIENGPNPDPDTFTVSEAGGDSIAFSLSETATWFALDKAGGATPEDVEVSVSISGLAPGSYFDSVTVSSGEAANSPVYKYVKLTVSGAVNNPPQLVATDDTLIDECTSLEINFSASDPDGDTLTWDIDGLVANMNFTPSGSTATLTFDPDTSQAGGYELIVSVTDGIDTTSDTFLITVLDCFLLSEDSVVFSDTADGSGSTDLAIFSSGADVCFTIECDPPAPWLTFVDTSGCTPDTVTIFYDATGLLPGTYQTTCSVIPIARSVELNIAKFSIELEVLPPPVVLAGDTLIVATVPAIPGQHVTVPVEFRNQCDLIGILVWLEWVSEYLVLDSVSWVDTRLQNFAVKVDSIFNDLNQVFLLGADDTAIVPPGYGNFVNLHFTLSPHTPIGFYEIDLLPMPLPEHPVFTEICNQGVQFIQPEFIAGGIVVEAQPVRVCGYVVDTNWQPIPNAFVELWQRFPLGAPHLVTTTDSTGYFEFIDASHLPFDLWGHKEGYYPNLVEGINYGDTGVTI
ncbi:MAG: Ig-like domain-containing protein, partial [Candidatus Zixiibacteriota bacterium]